MPKAATPDDYFAKLIGNEAVIAAALKREIEQRWPHLDVKLAWGFPCWSGQERIFSVIAQLDRCNLQLWQGAELADAFPGRIEGTGKSLRHVKVRHSDEIDDELIAIMARAVELGVTAPQRVR